jgi:tetratricopeptide (TPR) repeat protein
VPNLKIVARSSAYTFKNQTKQAREVGQALGATHLVEGSVREDGSRIRITAQLIEAQSGLQLWSESYDRNVTDVFATQEEIAEAIAGSLRLPLGLSDSGSLVRNRTADTATYDQYLRAKALVRTRGLKPLTDGAALLEEVVARDPAYAPAWAVLAIAYEVRPIFEPAAYIGLDTIKLSEVVKDVLPKADAAARKAVELDPTLPDGYAALAHSEDLRGHLVEAEDLYLKAIALDAETPDALHYYADLLAAVGHLKKALAIRQRLQVLEPFVPIFNANTAAHLWLNGETDAAIALAKTVPDTALQSFYIPMMHAAAGRNEEAARSLRDTYSGVYPAEMVEHATHLLLHRREASTPPQVVPPLGALWWAAARAGNPSDVLASHEAFVYAGYSLPVATAFLWHPAYAEARKTERFKTFMRKVGIVDYWRARGWPEFCRPLGSDDFMCE